MDKRETYSVKQLAMLSGVTVRALHHYDSIGLLSPDRLLNGYRLYTYDDVLRLQQILVSREMGFSLEAIKQRLDEPDFDYSKTLLMQRKILVDKISAYKKMIGSLDSALEQLQEEKGDFMTLFSGFNPEDYKQEVKDKWGESEAYQHSERRTKNYTKQDWQNIKDSENDWLKRLKECFLADEKPDSAKVLSLAEEHRHHISKWFYDCSYEMHQNLGSLYIEDPRFKDYYDQHAKGLAKYLQKSIQSNARKLR